jgi:GNAT superfamily N-acetyltransferase
MILHEITRAVFMATNDQKVVPGSHDVQDLLANLEPPGWFEDAVVPITKNPCYATAKARPYKGSSLSTRPLENQILLVLDEGRYSLPVGLYLDEVLAIEPDHQGKGLSTELILRCCAHRLPPTRRTLTPAGKRALERAHDIAVHNAHTAGCHIPADVRLEYRI